MSIVLEWIHDATPIIEIVLGAALIWTATQADYDKRRVVLTGYMGAALLVLGALLMLRGIL